MGNERFDKGEYVVYGTNGICLVEDIRLMRFASYTEKSYYYVLRPVNNDTSVIYVPMNNEKLMDRLRSVMTKEDIDSLLAAIKGKEIEWENNRRFRTEHFHEILVNGVNQKLLLMIRCIYMRKRELTDQGKKLPTTDENTLKAAERLVNEEFAHALCISKTDVGEYIRGRLDINEKKTS